MSLLAVKLRIRQIESGEDYALNVASQLMVDLPTLFIISSFSVFAYYLSKLTIEIESVMRNQHTQTFFGIQERISPHPKFASQNNKREGSNFLLSPQAEADSYNGSDQFNPLALSQTSNGSQANLTKILFILANITLYCLYLICFTQCKSLSMKKF